MSSRFHNIGLDGPKEGQKFASAVDRKREPFSAVGYLDDCYIAQVPQSLEKSLWSTAALPKDRGTYLVKWRAHVLDRKLTQ